MARAIDQGQGECALKIFLCAPINVTTHHIARLPQNAHRAQAILKRHAIGQQAGLDTARVVHAVHHFDVQFIQSFGAGMVGFNQVVEHVGVDADAGINAVFGDQKTASAQRQAHFHHFLRSHVDAGLDVKNWEYLLNQHFGAAVLIDRKVQRVGGGRQSRLAVNQANGLFVSVKNGHDQKVVVFSEVGDDDTAFFSF